MKNLFKFSSAEEFEIRNENLAENIEEKDEPIVDNNNINYSNLDEALLFSRGGIDIARHSDIGLYITRDTAGHPVHLV